jgi:hypothetical protein
MLGHVPKLKLAPLSNSSFYASAQPISLASTKPKGSSCTGVRALRYLFDSFISRFENN